MSTSIAPAPDTATDPTRIVAVVLNGAAGALLDQPDAAETLRESFAAAGLTPHFIPHDAGTLPERVALARDSGAAIVVVAGGDGTIACAAQMLAGSDIALGILPFGTMNLLAKDLNLPIGDVAAGIRILAAGHARLIDVAEVNGRVFLCASMLGLPARLGRVREQQRGAAAWILWPRMARALLRALGAGGSMRASLRLDGEHLRLRAASLTITANRLDDGAGRVFGRSRLDGGELGVYLIRRMTVGRLLRLSARLMLGRWRQDPAIEERRAQRLAIASRDAAVRVMNDGEALLLTPPLHYRIRPQALRVIAPPPDASSPDALPR